MQVSDPLTTMLDRYNSTTLFEIAAENGVVTTERGKKLSKSALLPRMRAEFFTTERVQASFQRLSERERAVLNRLLVHGGTVETAGFRRELLRAGLVRGDAANDEGREYRSTYVGSPTRSQSALFEDVLARLTLRGLVFSRDDEAEAMSMSYNNGSKQHFTPGPTLFVPEVIRAALPLPQPITPATAAEPAVVKTGDPALLLRDLYLYWDFVRHNEVSLTKGGAVPKRLLKAINAGLLEQDATLDNAEGEQQAGRLALLRGLLIKLKLLRSVGGRLVATRHAGGLVPEFWSWPQSRQVAACVEAWPDVTADGDLPGARDYGAQPGRARQVLLKVLRNLPAHQWFEPDDLHDKMRVVSGDFLLPERSRVEKMHGSWYQSSANYRVYGTKSDILRTFDELETGFVQACLSGFLSQIGLVELGYEGEWPRVFRLTQPLPMPDGAAAQASNEPADGAGKLIIQPNFELLAIGPVGLDVLAWLDLFAERTRADRGAFAYRLNRRSVYQGQQAGLEVAEAVRFLERTAATDLPQNVRRSLEEWAAEQDRIVFRSGVSLLHAARPELLAALMAAPETAPLLARAVSPEVALVSHEGRDAILPALLQRGLFPAMSDADAASADHSVEIKPDGAIRPVHAVPSLHLRGRLARLAEEEGNGSGAAVWRLTPQSVARAGGGRAQVRELLAELERLQCGPLPLALVDRIKSWGGYYGTASTETLTLIEFQDPEALRELRQRVDLRSVLLPFTAGNRSLAAVPTDQLAHLKQVLAGLGVRVKEGIRH